MRTTSVPQQRSALSRDLALVPSRSGRRVSSTFLAACVLPALAAPALLAQGLPAPSDIERDDPVTLSVFEVTGETGEGYRSTQTLSGSRTMQLLRDTPSSISVLNRELMEDLIVTDIEELSMYNISGEINVNNESPISSGGGGTISRGINTTNLRDGVTFFVSMDSHSIDRVELLRGPNGFLYTGSGAGGVSNQVTKQALRRNAQKLTLVTGSKNLYRAEYDISRIVNRKLAVRASLAYQRGGGYQNHTGRTFRGMYLTANYRPTRNTNVNVSTEFGESVNIMAPNLLADQFSTTDRTGATAAITATQGGYTYLPARGLYFDTVGLRRSTGTNLALGDDTILSHLLNLPGPGAYNKTDYYAHNLTIDQRVGEKLNLQLFMTHQQGDREIGIKGGSFSAAVYRDQQVTLPNGQPNPYYGAYYTEMNHGMRTYPEPVYSFRFSAVYDLKLPFMTQRLLAGLHYQSQEPLNAQWAEYVDPANPKFKGTLINANTLAAYTSNLAVMNQNRVYRRFYLRDGDNEQITRRGTIPGETIMLRDIGADSAAGRISNRYYWNDGGSVGATGTYFKERLHTMVGWRTDAFKQNLERDFYNMVTGETYQLDSVPRIRYRARESSYTYGGVLHITKFLSLYGTYAENVVLTTTSGQGGVLPGTTRPPPKGFGTEFGVRWLFLNERLESNWTYYRTNNQVSATPPATSLANELAILVPELNPTGLDSQITAPSGIEFDTVANLTKNWRLMWNISTNKLKTSDRYPQLKAAREMAQAAGHPTPVTDAFLATVPDGTPVAGFTKLRSNLVTSYRFESGFLKGFSIGGGGQYREKTYQGNFDRNLDGVAEELWTPSYFIGNLMLGYRTRLWNRTTNIGFNINNVFDKRYFRATALSTGAAGIGRQFRLSVRVDL